MVSLTMIERGCEEVRGRLVALWRTLVVSELCIGSWLSSNGRGDVVYSRKSSVVVSTLLLFAVG